MRSAQAGKFQLDIVSDGTFKLDGGQMFSIVPKVLWERSFVADERNRVTLGLNCLLIRGGGETILVDTGAGESRDEVFCQRYGRTRGASLLHSLAETGIDPADVTMVVDSHLHFDHAGGNTKLRGGHREPAFPHARYIVQRGEYEHALAPHERDRASYIQDDFEVIAERGLFEFVSGDQEIAPGITVLRVPGHNLDTQCVRVQSGGETAFFFSDTLPTQAHLNPPWMMSFDLYPVELLKHKKRLLAQAAEERWLGVLYHDPQLAMGRIVEGNGKYRIKEEPGGC